VQPLLYFATSNNHKFREAKDYLHDLNIEIMHLDIQYPEVQHESLEIIAKFSAIEVSKAHKGLIFVEDSGLFIKQLNGFPGPYSSYVNTTIGPSGLLKLLNGEKFRAAYFQSVIAFAQEGELQSIFEGKIEGSISETLRGNFGFAFDVCFVPRGFEITFAEMSLQEKNKISHRRRSLEKFAQFLADLLE